MKEIFVHFFLGMVVSFIGSIPLGTVNLSLIQTTLERNIRAGIYFAIGATIVEFFYSFIALVFSGYLVNNKEINLVIQFIAVPAFAILAISNFSKKDKPLAARKERKGKSFVKGVIVGIFNPLQIPFWLAYGTYFLSNNWMKNEFFYINIFVVGICVGTMCLLTLLAFLSKKIANRFQFKNLYMNKIMGYVFVGLALYQAIKVTMKYL